MNYTIRLFAGIAEHIGKTATIALPEPQSVDTVIAALQAQYPEMYSQFQRALIAVNRVSVDVHHTVHWEDEIALIPPVGGGSPVSDAFPSRLITSEPLSVESAFRQLESVYCGGTVLFCGTVREWTKDKQTDYLEYESYLEMAMEQMRMIEDDVKREWPGVLTLQWHRVGKLLATDVAVICAAAAPHRAHAFEASRCLIERMKKEVPIWKKEYFKNGDAAWRENTEA